MFIVMKSFPNEKILFASDSEKEATDYFNMQIQHGQGFFELWQENTDFPILTGGEQLYSNPNELSGTPFEA